VWHRVMIDHGRWMHVVLGHSTYAPGHVTRLGRFDVHNMVVHSRHFSHIFSSFSLFIFYVIFENETKN
jgi:hypothetical protein